MMYYVIDSVLATQGRWKNKTVWSGRDVIAAALVVESYTERDGLDYIILDENGQVV